jgi:hypothetical protein
MDWRDSFIKAYTEDDYIDEPDYSHLKSAKGIPHLFPLMVAAAQKVYDEWDSSDPEYGDAEVGFGGICHLIADEICSVLSNAGYEASTVSASMGDVHVYVLAKTQEGVYEVDIHPSYYETGGGYNWEKIPNVTFSESDISFNRITANPNDFEGMTEAY